MAKQSEDHERLDDLDSELAELRQLVTVQKGQIEMIGQMIALVQANPNSAQVHQIMQQQLATARSSSSSVMSHTQPGPPAPAPNTNAVPQPIEPEHALYQAIEMTAERQ